MTDWDYCLQLLSAGVNKLKLRVPVATRERLIDYIKQLQAWNATYNLTAIRQPQDMVTRHLLDSLAVLPYTKGKSLADIGSGAGLPGIVLALAKPKLEVTVVEAVGKKAAFMRHVRRKLELPNLTVLQARVETITPEAPFDVVISRAFASANDAIELAGHLLAPQGQFLLMKGRHPSQELGDMPADFRVAGIELLDIPGLQAQRHLVRLEQGII